MCFEPTLSAFLARKGYISTLDFYLMDGVMHSSAPGPLVLWNVALPCICSFSTMGLEAPCNLIVLERCR